MKTTSGIYRIYCNKTGRTYIGSSCNVKYRITQHKRDLKLGVHANYLIQNDYKMYGIDSFDFSVVEYCADSEKLKREKYYAEEVYKCINIDGENPSGYNLAKILDFDTQKQHVPHKYMSNKEIKLAKILLSIGIPISPISRLYRCSNKDIKGIYELYNYRDIYSDFNNYIIKPSTDNIFNIGFDDIYKLILWKF